MELCIFDLSERYNALVSLISNPSLVSLVHHTIPVSFFECPGAAKHHHAYRHGLFQHTVEVAEYAFMLASSADDLTRYDMDVLIVSALLHDVAKTAEYTITFDAEGKDVIGYGDFRIGHVIQSVIWMERANAKCSLVLESTCDDIARTMLAHHGHVDWGTPKGCTVTNKRCNDIQAILHAADMISAGK